MDQFLEEALILAEQMGHDQFKASNGWLECFKKCHNIRQFAVSGEEADVAIPKSIINGSIQIDGTDFTASVKTINVLTAIRGIKKALGRSETSDNY